MTGEKEEQIVINRDFIRDDAEAQVECEMLPRMLTSKEIDEAFYRIWDRTSELVLDSIYTTLEFNEMLKRNEGAEKHLPHFKVFWRNPNAYQDVWKERSTFTNEEDARAYIHDDFIAEDDHWKLVFFDELGAEKEVYRVH